MLKKKKRFWQENILGNVFGTLQLMERGDEFYIVERSEDA
jgi:hypothetical protein